MDMHFAASTAHSTTSLGLPLAGLAQHLWLKATSQAASLYVLAPLLHKIHVGLCSPNSDLL